MTAFFIPNEQNVVNIGYGVTGVPLFGDNVLQREMNSVCDAKGAGGRGGVAGFLLIRYVGAISIMMLSARIVAR